MAPGGGLGFATIPRTLKFSGNSPAVLFEVLADAAGEDPGPGKNAEAARDPVMTEPYVRIQNCARSPT
uniref:Uncharacterized protein n=1 Tax=Arundo donax TaxID=35708 RepID=A0A0A9DB35_ARUDO